MKGTYWPPNGCITKIIKIVIDKMAMTCDMAKSCVATQDYARNDSLPELQADS